VVENLLLGRRGQAGERLCAALLARRRVAREERAARARAREILHEIDLGAYENVAAGALSGGQHKLLELGRALMAAPRALLLDEPCAGVSPALLDVLSTVLDRLRRNGVTLLIVEHNVSFVRRHCEHLVVMERGRKLLEGEPGAVLHDRRVLDAFLEARVA
jgi:branched-chain amino acid transport system ATP-binding protein